MERISLICYKLGRFILLAFLFLLPLVILPGAMHKFAIAKLTLFRVTVVVLLVLWGLKAVSDKKAGFKHSPLDLPVLVFLAANVLATALSLSHSLSIMGAFFQRQEGLLTLFGYTVLFFATVYFFREKEMVLAAIKVGAVSSILVSLYGLAQYLGYDIFGYSLVGLERVRSFSTLGNPDLLGSYLVLILPLNLGLILVSRNAKEYSLGIAAFLVAALALVFTFTRGAWLAAFLSIAVTVFYAVRTKSGRGAIVLLVVIVLATGLIVAIDAVGAHRGYSLEGRISSLLAGGGSTGEARLLMWKNSLKVIRGRPLWGWGPETFRDILPRYASLQLMRLEGKRVIERPHNQTLYMAASAGVLGVMGYFWLIAAFLLLILSRTKRNDGNSFYLLRIALLAGALGYFIQEQFLFSFVSVTPLLWVVLGLAVALTEEGGFGTFSLGFNSSPDGRPALLFVIILLGLVGATFSWLSMDADLEAGLGRDAIATGNLQAAVSSLQRATMLNPWEPRYRSYLGAVCSDLGVQTKQVSWLERAAKVYRDGLRQNPYDYMLSLGLDDAYYQMAQLGKGSDYALASRMYAKTLELNPFLAETHLRLGIILSLQKEWERSLSQFEAALSISPSNVEALDGIAEVYEKKGELLQSQGYFERALAVDSFDQVAREGIKRLKAKMSSIPGHI